MAMQKDVVRRGKKCARAIVVVIARCCARSEPLRLLLFRLWWRLGLGHTSRVVRSSAHIADG